MPRARVIAVLVVLSPFSAIAQVATLPVGARVRVASIVGIETQKMTGTFVRLSEGLFVVAAKDSVEHPIALSSVTSIQVSRGSNRGKGALRGLLVGGAVAMVIPLTALVRGDRLDGFSIDARRIPQLGLVGALLGMAIAGERWETVPH